MNTWEQLLLGELIGLARATDGNEHLITDELTGIIQEILIRTITATLIVSAPSISGIVIDLTSSPFIGASICS